MTAAVEAPGHVPVRGWTLFTTILTLTVFLQAITAGRLLDGDDWARDAHRATAGLLILAAIVGGVLALTRLRDRAGGKRFGLMLVAFGVGLVVQYALGSAAAEGNDTLWIHLPLGVALVGFTMQLNRLAHTIGQPT